MEVNEIIFHLATKLDLFDDGRYKYRSIWNNDVFCCFTNIKTLDQTLVELEQLRI